MLTSGAGAEDAVLHGSIEMIGVVLGLKNCGGIDVANKRSGNGLMEHSVDHSNASSDVGT